jgi:hypothetical protein
MIELVEYVVLYLCIVERVHGHGHFHGHFVFRDGFELSVTRFDSLCVEVTTFRVRYSMCVKQDILGGNDFMLLYLYYEDCFPQPPRLNLIPTIVTSNLCNT